MSSNIYLYFAVTFFHSYLLFGFLYITHMSKARGSFKSSGCSAWSGLHADSQLSSGSQSLLAPGPYFWGWICLEIWLLSGISTIWCGSGMQITRSISDGRVCHCSHGKWHELSMCRVWHGRTTPRSWNLGCRHHWQQYQINLFKVFAVPALPIRWPFFMIV